MYKGNTKLYHIYENIFIGIYFLLALVSFLLFSRELFSASAVTKVLGLLSLATAFFFNIKRVNNLFTLLMLSASLGGVIIIFGIKNFPNITVLNGTIHFWILFFLIRKDLKKYNVNLDKKNIPAVLILATLLIYLLISVFSIANSQIKVNYVFYLACAISFILLGIYVTNAFIKNKNLKNSWIVSALLSYTMVFVITPVEAIILSSVYLKIIIDILIIATYFFVYKFITTPEEVINTSEKVYL